MNTHADRLFRVVFFIALAGLPVGCTTQHIPDDQRQIAEPAEVAKPLVMEELARDGRVLFSRQPNEAELRAFAAYGGSTVINARTQREVDKLKYDERTMVESLGMNYVHIPMSGSQLSYELAAKLTAALEANDGTALLHCASGSRMNGLYVVHQSVQTTVDRQTLVAQAVERGMGRGMIQYIERTLMQTPTRVMDAVEPARLIDDVNMLVSFGTRHTLSDTASEHRGIGAARRWVKSEFEKAIADSGKTGDETPTASFDVHRLEADGRRILEPVEIANVICTIPGAMPEARRSRRYYVLAHLDSRATDVMDAEITAPGANDDGSGVAVLMELARVLAKEHLDATVVLMATVGEEQGLYGAREHAKANREGIAAVLNNDMVGDPTGPNDREDREHIRVFSQGIPSEMLSADPDALPGQLRTMRMYGGESDNTSRQLARYIYDVARLHRTAVQPMLVMRPDRFLRGGDHTPFDEMGLPAIRFTEVHESYDRQHQDIRTEDGIEYGDVAQHVDAAYLADVTKLNAATLIHLANAPSVPTNARIIIAELTNDTTLRWDACPETDVAGYEIVWRETTSAVWQKAQDVGNTTEGTVDLSKDNYFFGVRAYDKDGYRSPVAFPGAARE